MEYRTIPDTTLKMSRLSLGSMTFGSQVDEQTAGRMVDLAIEAGINSFDTANIYNGGRAEEFLGAALRGRRDKVILASKVRGKTGEGKLDQGLSADAIEKAFDASLKRLKTDYLDIYYLHQPDYDVPIEETLAAMENLIRSGKVRYLAVSNYAAWQTAEIHCISAAHGYQAPRISQLMYNLLARGIEDEYLPFSARFGVGIVAYNPLAGGLLSGKYRGAHDQKLGGRFDNDRMYQDRYWHQDYFAAVDDLAAIALAVGISLTELSLRWLLSRTQVASVLLGASRIEQLQENLNCCERPQLHHDALDHCDNVWKRLRGITPKYNR
jgi:1-deoxyxylulose-5-phosphate synthase